MKAGILAGGAGSRFLEAGWETPKPLIKVGGIPIISRVLDNLFEAGVEEVQVLLNGEPRFNPVEAHLQLRPDASRIQVIRRITKSSFESFEALVNSLGEPPFVISTVDAIFSQGSLRAFLDLQAYPSDAVLVLAVTDFVHDENPLWVSLAEDGQVLCLGDSVSPKMYVTAGLYLLLHQIESLGSSHPFSALRQFLHHLTAKSERLWGMRFEPVLDIDGPADIVIAESVLEPGRAKQFGNSVSQ